MGYEIIAFLGGVLAGALAVRLFSKWQYHYVVVEHQRGQEETVKPVEDKLFKTASEEMDAVGVEPKKEEKTAEEPSKVFD